MREWLAAIRKANNLSQYEVARRVGIAAPSYYNIETGKRNPSVPTAQKIASVLGFDWTEFFEKEESA